MSASVVWVPLLKSLREKYRIVFFDMGGYGLNTRLKQCSGISSPEAAEGWLIEWLVKLFNALDLPETFFLAGHSCGGWLASLYASTCPKRVEQLFLISPGGTEPYDEKTYDPYKLREQDDLTRYIPKKKIDSYIQYREQKKSIVEEKTKHLPRCMIRRGLSIPRMTKRCHRLSPELVIAYINYFDEMIQRCSILDAVLLLPSKHPMMALHPLQCEDRLCNPEIDFPIGMVFGDSDYMGSEGADEIIKRNKHFESGRS